MIGNPTEGLKLHLQPHRRIAHQGRMISNPTEGLKLRWHRQGWSWLRGRMIGNPTEGLKQFDVAGARARHRRPNDRQPN